ncbi:hypothetical protein E6Q11_05140 [Candidatus Dojkabacteria bacterium]|uniref:Uncharacterized protein n=1 Tax=Candidatus Dojkabacteria bacterium TaxID=2099670 RepID=A0A5C7J3X1_9BACT|nr:MAG: hypothetical protein E6Q11_05140 [Candidatus Dojkabacteria bacterium]
MELKGTIIAIDKNSNGSMTKGFSVKTKDEFDEFYKGFDNEVPYTKWYFEIELDETELDRDEIDEIIGDYWHF